MKALWHRLLCRLKIRDEFDYDAPMGPEAPHPYEELPGGPRCCYYCGGGKKHAIHQPPFAQYRIDEIERVKRTGV